MKKSDWDDETAEMIKKSRMMSELGVDEDGVRTKKPVKSAKAASANLRASASSKKKSMTAAKRKAIQQIMKTGIIPASPTR